ncbi:MAG: NAD-binding protein [Anaerolineales bacterium]|jgi:voltage-gated potassium channel Kch
MNKPTFKQRFRYQFDNMMAKGTSAMVILLGVASFFLILAAGLFIVIFRIQPADGSDMGLGEAIWASLMRTLDPGTMGADSGAGFRGVMLIVTIGGIFIVSALIGVLNSGLEKQLGRLQKGRSRVLENGHTLILGWSPQIFTIISELMIANENKKNARIVVLARQDKVEMEEQIRERIVEKGSTRVIVRFGNPIDLNDLELGSPHTARAIIVLPPENDDPDSYVIKTVLAITNNPNRREEPYHIVTQIRDRRNMDVVRMVGAKDKVFPLLTGDLIARVVAQTSRQSGLSVVYTELMNFGGDEIYFKQEPTLSGKTFGEALLAYEDSTVMGMRKMDGRILLNPPMDTRIEPGDYLFALSEDDDTILLSGITNVPIEESLISSGGKAKKTGPERTLLIGWNRSAAIIVQELDAYVANGSQVTVLADETRAREAIKTCEKVLNKQKLTFVPGDTTNRELLDSLNIMEYNHVIVLAASGYETQETDARTLVTLLHLRDIVAKDETPFSIVSEMLDLRNRELAEVAQVDDFIVSEHLISLMLSQLSEDDNLFDVFQNIFAPEGAEIYLKPVEDYVETGQPVTFYTVVEAARRRGETALGYRIEAEANDAETDYGVYTNPRKSEKVIFAADDRIIVVAEE